MVFTQTGLKEINDWIRGASATAPTHIATGTDNTAASDEDTSLGDEKKRVAVTIETYTDSEVTFSVLIDSGMANGNTLEEAGLFNANSSGDMFSRFTHGAISKTSNIEVEYLLTLKFTNG